MNALLSEADTLRQSGRLAEAEHAYQRAIAGGAPTGEAYYGLGLTYKTAQKPSDALTAFQKAASDPNAPMEAFVEAGIITSTAGQQDQAIGWIKAAADRYPRRYEPAYFLGSMLARGGHDNHALEWLRRAAEINPDNSEICQALVGTLRRLRMMDEAQREAARWIAIYPADPAAHAAMAHIHLERNRPAEARPFAQAVVRLAPDNPDGAILNARVEGILENMAEAKRELERARALAPNRPDIYVHLGNHFKVAGRMDEARAALRKALSLSPTNIEAFFELSEITTFKLGDPLVTAMGALADAAKEQAPAQLLFALGKAHDDMNETARAFQYFAGANERELAVRQYDEATTLNALQRIKETFSVDFLVASGSRGVASDLPIFIVGMPRSGSTLVEQILASHPNAAAGGERAYFRQTMDSVLAARAPNTPFPENLALLTPDDVAAIGHKYLEQVQPLAAGRKRVTDKLLANGLVAGLIHAALPGAKIVHCLRDPLDTCLSAYTKSFGQRIPYATDLGSLGRYYREQTALMSHWRKVLPAESFLEVRYEDLVTDLEGQARRLVAFCGLDWSDACMDFHNTDRPVNTASVAQVREPIHSTSVGRWRRYAIQLQPLIAALKDNAA